MEFLTSEDEDERKNRENSKWIKIEGMNQKRISEKEKEIEFNLNAMDERLGEIGLGKPLDNLDMDHVQWMNPNNWKMSYFSNISLIIPSEKPAQNLW